MVRGKYYMCILHHSGTSQMWEYILNDDIDSFESLATVTGAIDMSGVFKNVSLPALSDVRGGFNLQSTNDVTDSCDTFSSLHDDGGIKGNGYTCKGKQPVAKSKDGGASTTGDGSSDNSTGDNKSDGSGRPTAGTLFTLAVVGFTVMAL